jgi:hypothetical protein
MGHYGRILDFLDRSRYFFFQVAPQLYSRGRVDPVPDPVLLRKSGSARTRTRTPGSVGKNSDHWTAEAVEFRKVSKYMLNCGLQQRRVEVPRLMSRPREMLCNSGNMWSKSISVHTQSQNFKHCNAVNSSRCFIPREHRITNRCLDC